MSISVPSEPVRALNDSLESLFSDLQFSVGRLLEPAPFSAIANTFWLSLWNEEDARKFLALYAVAFLYNSLVFHYTNCADL